MIYGYARVSTIGQATEGNSLEDQEKQLRENGAVEIYEEAWTGTKLDRPEFQKILQKIKKGDTLVVTKLDRLSRNAQQGLEIVQTLTDKGVKVNILNMGMVDMETPVGKLMMTMLLAFAEFERNMIVERTQAGKAIKRASDPNWHEGGVEDKAKTKLILEYIATHKEYNVSKACKELGVSRSKWYKVVRV